jgi:hypothetical protein
MSTHPDADLIRLDREFERAAALADEALAACCESGRGTGTCTCEALICTARSVYRIDSAGRENREIAEYLAKDLEEMARGARRRTKY